MGDTNLFRGLVVAMFTVIIGMTGYIMTTITNGISDARHASETSVQDANHRIDILAGRVNDIDHRLVAAETRIMDLKHQ